MKMKNYSKKHTNKEGWYGRVIFQYIRNANYVIVH